VVQYSTVLYAYLGVLNRNPLYSKTCGKSDFTQSRDGKIAKFACLLISMDSAAKTDTGRYQKDCKSNGLRGFVVKRNCPGRLLRGNLRR
jgi:hypothetical protein